MDSQSLLWLSFLSKRQFQCLCQSYHSASYQFISKVFLNVFFVEDIEWNYAWFYIHKLIGCKSDRVAVTVGCIPAPLAKDVMRN